MVIYTLQDDCRSENTVGLFKYREAAEYERIKLLEKLRKDKCNLVEPTIVEIELEENGLPPMIAVTITHKLHCYTSGDNGADIEVLIDPTEEQFNKAKEFMYKTREFSSSGVWMGAFTIQVLDGEDFYKTRNKIFKWYINEFNDAVNRDPEIMLRSLRSYFYNQRVIGDPDLELVRLFKIKDTNKEVTQNGE